MKYKFIAIIILAATLTGCSVSQEKTSSEINIEPSGTKTESVADDDFDLLEEELSDKIIEISDPLEPVNRIMYQVNDTLYYWILKPDIKPGEKINI